MHHCIYDVHQLAYLMTKSSAIRKTISLDTALWARIEEYQFQQRIKCDAEVIRYLIAIGLQSVEKSSAKAAPLRPRR